MITFSSTSKIFVDARPGNTNNAVLLYGGEQVVVGCKDTQNAKKDAWFHRDCVAEALARVNGKECVTFVTVDGDKATLKGARMAVELLEDPDDPIYSPFVHPKTCNSRRYYRK